MWKEIPGWDGFYEVNEDGRVRSVERDVQLVNRFGKPEVRRISGKELKLNVLKNGYLMVNFTAPGGVREYRYVHHLVAEAFIGPKPDGMEVCHNDGVRANNKASNLRYGSRSENANDRKIHGTMNPKRGVQHYHAKLTEDDVRWIRRNEGQKSQRSMARQLGVAHRTVGNVLRGEHWRHVT